MANPRQSVRVQIFNQSYSLLADGEARDVEEIAAQVDELMTSIASRAASADSTRVAVLACLHLADKLRSVERQLRSYADKSQRIANLLEEALVEAPAEKV
jgi:cell division protein ZapA